jgi:hypothetical protein
VNTSTGQGATLAVSFTRLQRFALSTMLFNVAGMAGAIVKGNTTLGVTALVVFGVGQMLFCWEK